MHFQLHLKDSLLDYGPIYAFWLFSFERFNGLLGTYTTNKRNIEIQLMHNPINQITSFNITKSVKSLHPISKKVLSMNEVKDLKALYMQLYNRKYQRFKSFVYATI